MPGVEALGVHLHNELKASAQLGVWRLHKKVEVVSHEAVRHDHDSEASNRSRPEVEEAPAV